MKHRLREVRNWAKAKLRSRQEPPWSWYQYMKLVETCDAILAGLDVTTPQADSPQSEPLEESVLQLAAHTPRPGKPRRRRGGAPVQLPM